MFILENLCIKTNCSFSWFWFRTTFCPTQNSAEHITISYCSMKHKIVTVFMNLNPLAATTQSSAE